MWGEIVGGRYMVLCSTRGCMCVHRGTVTGDGGRAYDPGARALIVGLFSDPPDLDLLPYLRISMFVCCRRPRSVRYPQVGQCMLTFGSLVKVWGGQCMLTLGSFG